MLEFKIVHWIVPYVAMAMGLYLLPLQDLASCTVVNMLNTIVQCSAFQLGITSDSHTVLIIVTVTTEFKSDFKFLTKKNIHVLIVD